MKNKYIVLVCGLNIRNHNGISLDEQQLALRAVADELDAQPVRDKGSYLIVSHHERTQIANLIVGALQRYRHDLEIPGVAVASPAVVGQALDELAMALGLTYGNNFDAKNHGIKLNGDTLARWPCLTALPRRLADNAIPVPPNQERDDFRMDRRRYPRRQARGQERALGDERNRSSFAAAATTRGY